MPVFHPAVLVSPRRAPASRWVAASAAWACAAVGAQGLPVGAGATPTPATAAVSEPAPGAGTAPPPGVTFKPVEVTAPNESDMRRLSTAAKIVIGREDIERFGDDSVGELLKRLPGVTVGGRPGRGGAPRMRGLGNGYTQILLDGERVPRGFSLDELTPDQIERIEILRAPTAETGARAIAGTINVITRGGYAKRVNDLKLGLGLRRGRYAPGVNWTRNDSVGDFIYNVSLGANRREAVSDLVSFTDTQNLSTGSEQRQREAVTSYEVHDGLQGNARLQWRLGGGDSLTLMPLFALSRNQGNRDTALTQTSEGVVPPAPYDGSLGGLRNQFGNLRLGGVWIHRLDDGATLRWSANAGQSHWNNRGWRENFNRATGTVASAQQASEQFDTTLSSQLKYSRTWLEKHQFVSGLELESNRRRETASTLVNGESPLSDFDGNLTASAQRLAAYAQDEWDLTPTWAAHAGLRWEGITTRGSVNANGADATNRSGVWTPLMHAVWRPNPGTKDQVRFSLTRSYRSPNLQDLIARPTINSWYLNRGPNDQVHPDRAGNPALAPELATGLDIAFERFLPSGGLLSANLFYRQLQGYMRSVTTLQTVSWADVPRWVARKQNVGGASTAGVELEAKFRLSDAIDGAPKIDVRSNLSLFRSRVDGVPGPDNRLDQQPDGVANLGADYTVPGWPLKVGGNVNGTPGFSTRLSDVQLSSQSVKFVADAYLLWTFSPTVQLRVSVNNFAGRDYVTGTRVLSINPIGQSVQETTRTVAPSFVNLGARLEIKL